VSETENNFDQAEEEALLRLMREIECVLFLSNSPVTFRELRDGLMCHENDLKNALARLIDQYDRLELGFYIKEVAGGFRYVTRSAYQEPIKHFFSIQETRRLSRASLETLAVIAYRQPVTKVDIEYTRGVGVSGVLNTLIERGLVRIAGRSEAPGRPFLYATTKDFLEFFGINDLREMPRLEGVDGAPEIVPPEPPTDQLDLGFNENGDPIRPGEETEDDEPVVQSKPLTSSDGEETDQVEVLPILPVQEQTDDSDE